MEPLKRSELKACERCSGLSFWLDGSRWRCERCYPSPSPDQIRAFVAGIQYGSTPKPMTQDNR
jgi:hypothetical protein